MARAVRLLLALCLLGCEAQGLQLSVDVRTDYLPGRQFVGVRTALTQLDGVEVADDDSLATQRLDFLRGERVADFDGLDPSTYLLTVSLTDVRGEALAMQQSVVDLRTDFVVTVQLTSNCRGVTCPGPGEDAARTSCVGGRCVDPRCSPETPEFCGDAGCVEDSQCAATSDCTVGACIEGTCYSRSREGACLEGFYCDPSEGCVVDPAVDAGVDPCASSETACADGVDDDCDGAIDCADTDCAGVGCDDGDACTEGDTCEAGACTGTAIVCDDGNPCTDDRCEAGACVTDDNTASCEDGIFCNGRDVCAGGACTHVDPPCALYCNEMSERCEACMDDGECGAVMNGPWSSCGGYTSTCDETGEQSREVTTPRCSSGTCTFVTTMETRSCSRDTDGTGCGALRTGTWSSCGGYTSTCDNTGTRTRDVFTPTCQTGSCVDVRTTETGACSRNTNGTSCGTTTFGAWGACGGFSNPCDQTGTQSRSVTTRICGSGTCQSNVSSESRACSRTVPDGTACGGTWQRCCSGTCVDLANNPSQCGACRVNCRGLPCTFNNGGYACSSCSASQTCRDIYDTNATCWIEGGNRCNCQCPSNGVCANGGCGAGFYCHDIPGNNFCSPNP